MISTVAPQLRTLRVASARPHASALFARRVAATIAGITHRSTCTRAGENRRDDGSASVRWRSPVR